MHIDHRQVTTINLQDGKPREYALLSDHQGYKLAAVSEDGVVHIALSSRDLQKMRKVLLREPVDGYAEMPAPQERPVMAGHTLQAPGYRWSATMDWLAYN